MSVATEVLSLAAVAALTALLVRALQAYLHFRRLELAIPGPASLPLLGNALDLLSASPATILKTIHGMAQGHSEMSRFSILNHLVVLVQEPADIEELLRHKDFTDKSYLGYHFFEAFIKKGLVQLGGAEWKAHRKWLAPAFSKDVLDRSFDVFAASAKDFIDQVAPGEEMEVTKSLYQMLTKSFLRTSMDGSDSSQLEDEILEVLEFLELFLRSINRRSFNPLLWPDALFLMTSMGRQVRTDWARVDAVVKRVIAKNRSDLELEKSCKESQGIHKNFFKVLLGTSNSGARMPEDAVWDETVFFFAASADTTGSALCWVLKVLSMLPEVQEKVHDELVAVLGTGGRVVRLEDVPKLEYLDRVIKECLRLFPPIPIVGRHCYAQTVLCGRTVPAGSTVFVNVLGAHRDPKHWPDPERFEPDRFLPQHCRGRPPFCYVPFSWGGRGCIGQKYAVLNMAAFLATALRAFRLLPVGDHRDLRSLADSMTFDLSSKLVGGTRVRFQPRARL